MNEIIIIKIGTIIISILGLSVTSLLLYMTIFKKGYQNYIDKDIYNKKLKSNIDIIKKSKPIGDWGGNKK